MLLMDEGGGGEGVGGPRFTTSSRPCCSHMEVYLTSRCISCGLDPFVDALCFRNMSCICGTVNFSSAQFGLSPLLARAAINSSCVNSL
jgi:hypothetical protein